MVDGGGDRTDRGTGGGGDDRRSAFDRRAGDGDRDHEDDPTVPDSRTGDRRSDAGRGASSPESDPDRGADPSSGPEPPGPDAVRNWTALTVALAAIALATAGVIGVAYESTRAVAGATVLGLGFGAIVLAGRSNAIRLFHSLDEAWTEHRTYVWFSTGLFAVGAVLGGLLYAAGVDLTELFFELLMEEFDEGELPGDGDPAESGGDFRFELTASFFIANNTPPFLAAVFGALSLGLTTFVIMFFNGVFIGNIVAVTGAEEGVGLIVALLVPHGIFELPALFIGAGVGFRFLHRVGQRIVGSRDAMITKGYLLRTAVLVGFAWLLLVLAAFVEAYVTLLVAEALFGAESV